MDMSEMYSPQLVTGTSSTSSVLEGLCENNKDIGDTVHMNTQNVHNRVQTDQKKTHYRMYKKYISGRLLSGAKHRNYSVQCRER